MGVAVNGQLLVMGGFVSGSLAVTSQVDVFDPDLTRIELMEKVAR